MLIELGIESLGAISVATAEFDRGLTVLTGETGTGKTMVVTGLHLLGGARADATRVRSEQTALLSKVVSRQPISMMLRPLNWTGSSTRRAPSATTTAA